MLLIVIFLIYFIGGIYLFFIDDRKEQQGTALGFSGAALIGSLKLFLKFKMKYFDFMPAHDFGPQDGYSSITFGIDGLSVSFLFLSALLIFLCIIFIWDEPKFKEYAINLFAIGFFLALVFTVQNILLFYVFFEAILIPMYIIIGVWGSRERKIRAVYLFFFYTLVGSLITLLGILYIFAKTGTLDYYYLCAYQFTFFEDCILWVLFFFAFASKIPMYPFHIWLPEAHVEAPTVGSVLLAGILLKLGVYGFLRFNIFMFSNATIYFAPLVCTLALVGVICASLTALRQTDLKRIIAYSSIAHMNLVVLGLFSLTSTGFHGAIIQSMSHGFVSGGMFLLVGVLYNRYHTRFLHYYGGLVHFMPIFSGFFLVFTMANIALPGTSSFIGEFLLLLGLFERNSTAAIIAALGVILSGAYSLWLYNRIIFGNIKINYTKLFNDINLREFVIMISLLIFVLVLGISPNIFISRISHIYIF